MKSVFAIAALGLAAPALAKKVPVSSGPVLTVREGLRQVYSASTTQEYVDAGAVCLDGAKRLPVTLSGDHNEISLATIGTYKVMYSCAGTKSATRTVVVVPTLETGNVHHSFLKAVPRMRLNDGEKQYFEEEAKGSKRSYVDAGAQCTYGEHDISSRVSIMGDTVDLKVQGIYTIKYECEAKDGAAAKVLTRHVYVGPKQIDFRTKLKGATFQGGNDWNQEKKRVQTEVLAAQLKADKDALAETKRPVIKLNGKNHLKFVTDPSDVWSDPGASCFYQGKDMSQYVKPVHKVIKLRQPMTTTITYTCDPPKAPKATEVLRQVTVSETAPVRCNDLGMYMTEDGKCEPCKAGTFGKYLPVTYLGKSHKVLGCAPCADGFVQSQTGKTSCKALPAAKRCRTPGHFTSAVTGNCERCAAFSYETGNVCKSCPTGKWAKAGAKTCQFSTCKAGTFQTATGSCDQCQAGRYQNKGFTTVSNGGWGRSFCFYCPKGTFNFKTGQAKCQSGKKCGAGTFISRVGVGNGFTCAKCPVGTSNGKGAQMNCDACESKFGFYAPKEGATKCHKSKCTPGYYSRRFGGLKHLKDLIAKDAFQSTTQSLNPNDNKIEQHGSTYELCTKCAFNTFQEHEGQAQCKKCPSGTYAGFGWAKCEKTTCGKGTYAKAWTIKATGHKYERCIECPINSYSNANVASSACTPCAAGTYAPVIGAIQCKKITCPKGEYQDPKYTQTRCIKCPAGTYSDSATTTCKPCSGDRWTFSAGSKSCTYETSCSVGTHWSAQAKRCVACPVGRFAAKPNQATCDACAIGTYQFAKGQNACKKIVCKPGQFMSQVWGTCMPCGAGEWSATGDLTYCYKCPRGFFNYKNGQTSCKASTCGPGTYQSRLPVGKKNSIGQPYSVKCRGSVKTSESACKGKKTNAIVQATTTCHRCPLNTYQPLGAMFYCFKCPAGKHTHFRGSQKCTTAKQCYKTHNGVFCTGVRRPKAQNPTICQNVKCAVAEWKDNLGTQHRRVRVTHVPGQALSQQAWKGNEPAETKIMAWAKKNSVDKKAFFTAHHMCRSNFSTSTKKTRAGKLADCSCWCW